VIPSGVSIGRLVLIIEICMARAFYSQTQVTSPHPPVTRMVLILFFFYEGTAYAPASGPAGDYP
jgi:hypothetical protein